MGPRILLIFVLTLAAVLASPQDGGWTPPEGWTPPPKDGDGGFTPPEGWTPPPKDGEGPSGGQTPSAPVDPEPTTTVEPPSEQPSQPTECTAANQGRCECGDTSKGFTTYTFWLDGVQRCFTVFRSVAQADEALPVVLSPNCYAKDVLMGLEMTSTSSEWNNAAARYGFARIGLSTPDGHWSFGNDGIVNDLKPMPCSAEDSKDMPYLMAVFDFIESNSDMFDSSRIWAQGFSQNSMFSAYISFCFNEKVLGVWQGGSGMALTGESPNLPGCQGQVSASDYATCDASGVKCTQCIEQSPCTECQYWPIYPCYTPKKPMVDCVVDYVNDMIANDKAGDPNASSALYMYERLLNEGHDARLLRFSPSDDGTIAGNHQDPKNKVYWHIGCLGITDPCSATCEASFINCVESSDTSTASNRADSFADCMGTNVFNGLDGCTETCAPTFAMLATSETPTTYEFQNFGAGSGVAVDQPASSLCTAASN